MALHQEKMVEFESKVFYRLLVGLLSFLAAMTLLASLSGSLLSVIPLVFVGTVLYAVLSKRRWVRTIVRVWAGFLIAAGGFKILATAFHLIDYVAFDSTDALGEIVWADVIFRTTFLIIGIAIFVLSKKYIRVVEKSESQVETEEAL